MSSAATPTGSASVSSKPRSTAASAAAADTPFALRGRVVTPMQIIDDGVVVIAARHLAWVGPATEAARAGWADLLASACSAPAGGYLLPGLVDVHCHGGGGESFPNAETRAQAMTAVREHRRHGTTSLVASCVTAAPEVLKARTRVLADLCDAGELAGIHFEGPFVSAERCGAQDPTYITDPDAALTRELIELGRGHVATMTIAPEKPHIAGDDGVVAALIDGGALPSFGHTDAEAAPVRAALADASARIAARAASSEPARSARATATHLFNGMRPMHHRKPGPVPEFLAAAASGECIVELIGDGVHLDPAIVRDMFETLGRENVVLITDALAAAGVPDGDYVLGSQAVTVSAGVARLAEGGALAGSTAHLIDVVRTTWRGGVDLVDAVFAASCQGAEILGEDSVGALEPSLWADVVVTDADLNPVTVFRRGEAVD
ncbi:N-acetylglucosamine-6-phosphate deacetylase [Actinomyces sp. 432]|nr:N-acetylglucosamine-6-phosphate deacetylase [Actinomyces sp. 432]